MKYFLFLLCSIFSLGLLAQEAAPAAETATAINSLPEWEDSLVRQFNTIASEFSGAKRQEMAKTFVPSLVKALKTPNSFHYPFSELENISFKYPADSSFRIITWTIPSNDKTAADSFGLPSDALQEKTSYTYYGAIQMNQDSLKLFPLIDNSSKLKNAEDTVLTNKNWYGCVYYNLIQKTVDNYNYYTLIGWNGMNGLSTQKIVDVLYFSNGQPFFGAPIFEAKKDEGIKKVKRFILEFKSDAGVSLNYDPKIDAIVYDFIKPQTEESKGAFGTYIPDGTVDGMLYKNGQWVAVPLIYESLGLKNTDPARQSGATSNSKKTQEKKFYDNSKKSKSKSNNKPKK